MAKAKDSTNNQVCPSCGVMLLEDAKFCHKCGVRAAGGIAAIWRTWKLLLLVIAISFASVGGMYLAYHFSVVEQRTPRTPSQLEATPSSPDPASEVDLSTMTPRQAADRLFNRVIAAEERGAAQQVAQFAPMALDAYRMVRNPDADLHYHMGLISLAVGDIEAAKKQLQNIKRLSPQHLLGLHLELRLAEQNGAESSSSDVLKRFANLYDAEITSGKPEYEAHRTVIDGILARASGKKFDSSSRSVPAGSESGKALFASKCAGCHGPDALGSRKGPPLVHRIYEPSHHADASFYRAVRQGVKSHHWSFGDMPPVPGVTDEQVGDIIRYVRKLQMATGIK
jgi:mono/diheme cytochrome c family protein